MPSAMGGHMRARTFGVPWSRVCAHVCHVLGQFIPVSSLSVISSFLFGTTDLSLMCLAYSALFVALTTVAALCRL